MNTPYTSDRLRTLFQSPYNPSEWHFFLQHLFHADELRAVPETLDCEHDKGEYLGAINTPDHFRIGLFHYAISHGSVVKKRVGLRHLVKSFINPRWGEFDAALVVFESGAQWRLSFICDIRGEATSPKRFTYVFGSRDLLYRTPIERFHYLQEKGVSFANIRTAFSVEALSDEFFNRYREQYADFVQYITGKRYVKSGSKWEERVEGRPQAALMQAFGRDDKRVRDYVKKMMGRLTFLHFLQRKGWMCGDLNYLQHLFEHSAYQDDYLDSVLEPLFFGILNTKPAEREALFTSKGWDMGLLAEWKEIPYLNGGLFECDDEDATHCSFPARYFRHLFQFFSEYNFTIDENDPTDAEIGVDPEMLGKIFENLLEDNKDKGAFYTPKEIVRYMCQESLIAYLNTNTSIAAEKIRRFVLSPEEGVNDIPENKKSKLLTALKEVKICDPAIGSGAFPMGLLNELLHCREVLSGEQYDRAEIKKSIIQNNIYGVDIEKGAVDIARLRFWLSIVVDEETPSPLPNLDYKIMQGNSLIESFMGVDLSKLTADSIKDLQPSLFDDIQYTIQKLVTQKLQFYYTCSDHEKKILIRQEIAKWINNQLKVLSIDRRILNLLQQLDLAGNKQFFLWHTWFSDVFNRADGKDGFDIVIGNPPYGAFLSEGEKVLYREKFKEVQFKINTYTLFILLATNLLKQDGISYYIIPNTLLDNFFEENVRVKLTQLRLYEINDLSDKIFETAVVHSMIFAFENTKMSSDYDIRVNLTEDTFGSFINIPCSYFKGEPKCTFSIRSYNSNGLQKKLKEQSIRLFDVLDIRQAIKTGNDKEYLVNTKIGDNFKPILRGKDIRRYQMNDPSIFVNYGKHLACPRSANIFEQPKILIREAGAKIVATYDENNYYIMSSLYNGILKNDQFSLKYILGLICSKLFQFLMNKLTFEKTKGAFTKAKIYHYYELPVKNISFKLQEPIIYIVDKILTIKKENPQADTSALEAEIDRLVYQLYGLTDEEIAIIERANE